MSKKTVREAYDRLFSACAALQPDVTPPEQPADLPVEAILSFSAMNCGLWGATVERMIDSGGADPVKMAMAVTMLRLASESYLAAYHELKGTFADAAKRAGLS
jgi:hypothetical protein